MARLHFKELLVYRLAEKLADAVWEMIGDGSAFERVALGKQMVRAADSVGANIAEGDPTVLQMTSNKELMTNP